MKNLINAFLIMFAILVGISALLTVLKMLLPLIIFGVVGYLIYRVSAADKVKKTDDETWGLATPNKRAISAVEHSQGVFNAIQLDYVQKESSTIYQAQLQSLIDSKDDDIVKFLELLPVAQERVRINRTKIDNDEKAHIVLSDLYAMENVVEQLSSRWNSVKSKLI